MRNSPSFLFGCLCTLFLISNCRADSMNYVVTSFFGVPGMGPTEQFVNLPDLSTGGTALMLKSLPDITGWTPVSGPDDPTFRGHFNNLFGMDITASQTGAQGPHSIWIELDGQLTVISTGRQTGTNSAAP
jgi:hypothetical protein